MKIIPRTAALIFPLLLFISAQGTSNASDIAFFIADSTQHEIRCFWKDPGGKRFSNIGTLKRFLKSQNAELLFASNGGMFTGDFSPKGLYIEGGKILSPIDRTSGEGNFYLKPNGVFFVRNDGSPSVCTTRDFPGESSARYATQSGPMLIIAGKTNPLFAKDSKNVQIRNGVGVLGDGRIIFAISLKKVTLHEFAEFFRRKGCKDALYLDGFVSKFFLPAENIVQTEGDLGVMIGITAKRR